MNHSGRSVLRGFIIVSFAVAVTVLICIRMAAFADHYMPAIKRFIALHGDYEKAKYYSSDIRVASEIRNIIPDGACIETSFSKDDVTFDTIIVKYYLYPLKIIDHWPNLFNQGAHSCRGHFYIDFKGTFHATKEAWHDRRVVRGVNVFALDEDSIFINGQKTGYPYFAILAGFIVFNLWVLFIGALACCIVVGRCDWMGRGGFLAAAFLLGFVLITLLLWLLLLLGLSLSQGMVVLVFSAVTVVELVIIAFRRISVRKCFSLNKVEPVREANGVTTTKSWVDLLMAAAGVLAILLFVLTIIAIPINVWDEMHIWLLKSKMYFVNRTLAFDYTVYTNNYYPVVWSLNIAAQYFFIGGMHDEVAKWTSALVFVAFIAMFFRLAISMGLARRFAWLAVLVYLLGFHHWTTFTALTENIYIALLCLVLFLALQYFVHKDKSCGGLLWLVLLGVSTVKFEGASIAFFLVVSYLLSGRQRFKGQLMADLKLAVPFLALLSIPILWQTWLRFHHIPFTIYHFQTGFLIKNGILMLIMSGFTVFTRNNLVMVGIVFVPLLILGWKKPWTQAERMTLVFCIFLILFSLTAGLCWETKELVLYYPEVLSRLFSRATPFLILLWAVRAFNSDNKAA